MVAMTDDEIYGHLDFVVATMVWPLLVGPNMPILMNADEDSDDDGG